MKALSHLLIIVLLLIACSKKQEHKKKQVTNVFYDIAFEFRDNKKEDSAFKYFNKAKDIFLNRNDSLGVAKCFANMGYISLTNGDYFGAQELSLKALDYFDKKIDAQFDYINANYNNLGKSTYHLKDYNNAIKFYDLAIKYSTDTLNAQITSNNKAKIYQEINEYDKALKIYELILKNTNINSIEYPRIITNIALTKWLQKPNYNPSNEFLNALNIRKNINDLWGLNSSYAHLADYYSYKNVDSTFYYGNKMYQVAQQINSPEDQLQALKTLIKFSPNNKTKQYFLRYQKLQDSLQNSRNVAKNQFALIRYESEKSKVANLELQKENTSKQYQIVMREIIIGSVLFAIVVASVFAWFWYKKRNQQLKLEKENAVRENQLKTSKKVHDVVANGLYRVMTEIDNQDEIDKEAIVDRLDDMYQKSRDISYEVEELKPKNEDFHTKTTDLLNSFITKNTTVIIKGNSQDLWFKVSIEIKYEIENILQELMVNMKKHSHATKVNVLFKQKDNYIHITYLDNGIGMATQPQFKNGLTNTGNRIKHIEGKIIFDTKLEIGLKILISFPIA